MSEGTVALIWPPNQSDWPWLQFWRQHREFLDEAHSLLVDGARVQDVCVRLTSYVSTDLLWVTQKSASPLLFNAFAEGLLHYRSLRAKQFSDRPFVTTLSSHRGFVERTISSVANRLSMVSLTGAESIWLPGSGQPLGPWLEECGGSVSVRCRPFEASHAERVRDIIARYVLGPNAPEITSAPRHPDG